MSYNSRYQDPEDKKLLDICTVLDPRVKSMPYLTETQRAVVHDSLHQKMIEVSNGGSHAAPEGPEPQEDIVQPVKDSLLISLLGDIYSCSVAPVGRPTLDELVKEELQR